MANVIVTDAANYVPSYNLNNFNPASADVLFANSSAITVSFGSFTISFRGSFQYDAYGNLASSSTATGFSLNYGSSPVVSVTGIQLDFSDYLQWDFSELRRTELAGDDTYTSAWKGGEYIRTFGGDDRIEAGTGNDTVDGGAGNDTFLFEPGNAGWGISFKADGAVVVKAVWDGDHRYETADRLYNIETIVFQDAYQEFQVAVQQGDDGDDVISGRHEVPESGFDFIHGRGGNDTITGSVSDDYVLGGSGDDLLYGGEGSDYLGGESGKDKLWGSSGDDSIDGGGGRDLLSGGSGDDSLDGSNGKDRLAGGAGNDELRGGNGDDRLIGGGGSDTLVGGGQADVLLGGKDRDVLLGHAGDDRLAGGAHQDVFKFHRGHGNDTITDFQTGTDLIEIGRGASRLRQLEFEQQGEDVLLSFADVTVLVEDISVAQLQDADNFLF
ncbi:calcium-binding protein [Cribrihabitans pelagius]|uniref:calcium-binding protein n=1 Tax=Cribrihabitans pelagius TaxID=1765746 RepID=UPI003B5BF965